MVIILTRKIEIKQIEKMIKVRVAHDLFDDPKRTVIKNDKLNADKFELKYEKSNKGLAELYEEDFDLDNNGTSEVKT